MERIEISVGTKTAEKWQKVDAKVKTRLEKSFERQIEAVSKKMAEADFDELLKEIRKEAEKNGLTPEILRQILNEE